MRRYEIALAVVGLLLGLMTTTLLLTPRLAGRSPESVAHSAVQPIALTFNRRVALDSAVDHFQLSPPVSGRFEASGNQILFTPAAPLTYGQTYTISLAAGLRGENKLPLLRGAAWQFQVTGPNLLYLRLEEDGRSALWLQALDGSFETRMVAGTAVDVWDYALTADGRSVLISNVVAEVGDELLLLNLATGEQRSLLACPGSLCRQARPQPGGQLVAYERTELTGSPGARQVWLLDTASGNTWPAHPEELFESVGMRAAVSHSPRWSADGRYLAYFKPDAHAIVILDLQGGIPVLVPANVNEMGEWSPRENRLLYTEFVEPDPDFLPATSGDQERSLVDDYEFLTRLVLFDLNAEDSLGIDEELAVRDGPAAWHPDGQLVAFTRSTGGVGRQIWLLDVDDLSAKPLTSDTLMHHSAPSWSPDGRYLVFMRSAIDYSTAVPSLWLYDGETATMAPVATNAFLPQWQR
jgi:Tol biopolymer transport system component